MMPERWARWVQVWSTMGFSWTWSMLSSLRPPMESKSRRNEGRTGGNEQAISYAFTQLAGKSIANMSDVDRAFVGRRINDTGHP